ncbi:MAG: Uma2 family endonuclease [Candidatus Poribacteria bacterium]|nr:Uma2 family endonuclease [Candidatus Poribacteria bacterium]
MMNTLTDFAFKQRKYMPTFPIAHGKPTIYIEGYPYEDDEPMPATEFHGLQINIFYDQLFRYFRINKYVHIGNDNFIYYEEGDITKVVAPDIFVVFGVKKYPLRRSFYTWSEGAVPVAVFEFLSDATADQDRHEKVRVYLKEMGVQEFFIHQPEMDKPAEFFGWRRCASGDIVEIVPDAAGGLFSEALKLWFRWEDQLDTHVRLLRPSLPDGTPINTSVEEEHLREQEQHLRMEAEARAEEAEARAEEAEMQVREESERRQALETELERLRAQLPKRS